MGSVHVLVTDGTLFRLMDEAQEQSVSTFGEVQPSKLGKPDQRTALLETRASPLSL